MSVNLYSLVSLNHCTISNMLPKSPQQSLTNKDKAGGKQKVSALFPFECRMYTFIG